MTSDYLSSTTDAPHLSAAGDNGTVATLLQALEQRVHRLEDAVASMQDTRALEERVVERVTDRMASTAAPVTRANTAVVIETRRRLPSPPSPVPSRSDPGPAPPPFQPAAARPPWLLFDLYGEVRAMIWMFFDRHYRVGWATLLVPTVAVVVMLVSWLLISGIWVLGGLLDRIIDLLAAFLAYKVLSREADRYRATIAKS